MSQLKTFCPHLGNNDYLTLSTYWKKEITLLYAVTLLLFMLNVLSTIKVNIFTEKSCKNKMHCRQYFCALYTILCVWSL